MSLFVTSCDNKLNGQLNEQILIPFLNYYMSKPAGGFAKPFKDLQDEIVKKMKAYQMIIIDNMNQQILWNNIENYDDIKEFLTIRLYKIQEQEDIVANETSDWNNNNSWNLKIIIKCSTWDEDKQPFVKNVEYRLSALHVTAGAEFNKSSLLKSLQNTKLHILPIDYHVKHHTLTFDDQSIIKIHNKTIGTNQTYWNPNEVVVNPKKQTLKPLINNQNKSSPLSSLNQTKTHLKSTDKYIAINNINYAYYKNTDNLYVIKNHFINQEMQVGATEPSLTSIININSKAYFEYKSTVGDIYLLNLSIMKADYDDLHWKTRITINNTEYFIISKRDHYYILNMLTMELTHIGKDQPSSDSIITINGKTYFYYLYKDNYYIVNDIDMDEINVGSTKPTATTNIEAFNNDQLNISPSATNIKKSINQHIFQTTKIYNITPYNLKNEQQTATQKFIMLQHKNEQILCTLDFKTQVNITGYTKAVLTQHGEHNFLAITINNQTTLYTLDLTKQLLIKADFQFNYNNSNKIIFMQNNKLYHETLQPIMFDNDQDKQMLQLIIDNITHINFAYQSFSDVTATDADYFWITGLNETYLINKHWTKIYKFHSKPIIKIKKFQDTFYIKAFDTWSPFMFNKNYESQFNLKNNLLNNTHRFNLINHNNYLTYESINVSNKIATTIINPITFDAWSMDGCDNIQTYDVKNITYWTFTKDSKTWLVTSVNLSNPINIDDHQLIKLFTINNQQLFNITNQTSNKSFLYTLDLKNKLEITAFSRHEVFNINDMNVILYKHQTKDKYLLFDESLKTYAYQQESDHLYSITDDQHKIYYFKTNNPPYKYKSWLINDYIYVPNANPQLFTFKHTLTDQIINYNDQWQIVQDIEVVTDHIKTVLINQHYWTDADCKLVYDIAKLDVKLKYKHELITKDNIQYWTSLHINDLHVEIWNTTDQKLIVAFTLQDINAQALTKANLLPYLRNMFIKNPHANNELITKSVNHIFRQHSFLYFNTTSPQPLISNSFDEIDEKAFKVDIDQTHLIITTNSPANKPMTIKFSLQELKAQDFTINRFKSNILQKFKKMPSEEDIVALFKSSYFKINLWNKEGEVWEINNINDLKQPLTEDIIKITKTFQGLNITILQKQTESFTINQSMFETKHFELLHFQDIIKKNSASIFFDLLPKQPPVMKSWRAIQEALWFHFKAQNYQFLNFDQQKTTNEPYYYQATTSLTSLLPNDKILKIDFEGRDPEENIAIEWQQLADKYKSANYDAIDITEKLILQYYTIDPNDITRMKLESFAIPFTLLWPAHFNYEHIKNNITLNEIVKAGKIKSNVENIIIDQVKNIFSSHLYWYKNDQQQYQISFGTKGKITITNNQDETTFTITALNMQSFNIKTTWLIKKIDPSEIWDFMHKYIRLFLRSNDYKTNLNLNFLKKFILFIINKEKIIYLNKTTQQWTIGCDENKIMDENIIAMSMWMQKGFFNWNLIQIDNDKKWIEYNMSITIGDKNLLLMDSIKLDYYDFDEQNKLITKRITLGKTNLWSLQNLLIGKTNYQQGSYSKFTPSIIKDETTT